VRGTFTLADDKIYTYDGPEEIIIDLRKPSQLLSVEFSRLKKKSAP
jgi:hypothetical protein